MVGVILPRNKARKKKQLAELKTGDDETSMSVVVSKKFYPIINPIGRIDRIPFGLELLLETEHLLIRAQENSGEHMSTPSEFFYDIIDPSKGRLYIGLELSLIGDGKGRKFLIKVSDFGSRPVLQFSNALSSLSCVLRLMNNALGATGVKINVTQPDGSKLGSINQKYNGWTPKFSLKNEWGKESLTVIGPSGTYCLCNCCSMGRDSEFAIMSEKGQIGVIYPGDNDDDEHLALGIRWPKELAVEQKATLLGLLFAVNIMFFSRPLFSTPNPVELYEEQFEEKRHAQRMEARKRDLELLGLAEDGTPINK